jgi:hypothetical protein
MSAFSAKHLIRVVFYASHVLGFECLNRLACLLDFAAWKNKLVMDCLFDIENNIEV